jgi:hypothetical protein
MKIFKYLGALAAAMLLVACGGGGNTLTTPTSTATGATPTASTLYVSSSISAILADGSTSATITVVAVNSSNVPVSGVPVAIKADSGQIVASAGTTNTTGIVTATLTAGNNATVRTINVTATSGSVTGSTAVQVISSSSTSPVAALTVVSSTPTIYSDGSTTATITALVRDASNNLLPNVPVAFAASSGGIVATSSITDASGAATATLSTAGDPTLRNITVTAKTGSLAGTTNVQVVAATGSATVEMGSGTGSAFTPGTIAASTTSLSAGGSTSLQVVLQQTDGTLYTQAATITFSSPCAAQNLATLTSAVTTSSGIAVATYSASGCSGTDPVTATATIGTTALSASTKITVQPASLGSIAFVSATPTLIALQGIGSSSLPTTSTVVFEVLDQAGAPRPGATVNFSLNTAVGGVSLVNTTGTTDANGQVQTVVESGTVATPVRVIATVQGVTPAIATQSSNLTISTGIPTQDSFSLAVGSTGGNAPGANNTCTNVEAWAIDGAQVAVTARLSDRFNNPIPDGTAISFHSEGGQIASTCDTLTVNGNSQCTVEWTSQNPRPVQDPALPFCTFGNASAVQGPWTYPVAGTCDRPGRSSLLAVAIGEESFTDSNGNGQYDAGEPWVDVPYRFEDNNETGVYTPTHQGYGEFFYDFSNLGTYEYPNSGATSAASSLPGRIGCTGSSAYCGDGQFNGVLCNDPQKLGYCGYPSTGIGAGNLIIMSDGVPKNILPSPGTSLPDLSQAAGAAVYQFLFADLNNNPLPAGTAITPTVTGASGTATPTPAQYIVPCTTEPTIYAFNIGVGSALPGAAGTLTITVQTPDLVTTVINYPFAVGP